MNPAHEVAAPVDFVIVTALEEERGALLSMLPDCKPLPPEPGDVRHYYSGRLPVTMHGGAQGHYSIVVMQLLGMGRVQAATATSDAIKRWRPRFVVMVGIAGGVAAKHVGLGDILVSQQVVDYELQKLTQKGPEIRWQVHQADARLLGASQQLTAEAALSLLTVRRPLRGVPQRIIGPIASGDKVIAFGAALEQYRQHWATLIGVEMEAAGVATAVSQAAKPPGFFMVRGVSDLADANKDSKHVGKWRAYACHVAAAYTVALLQGGPVPFGGASRKTKRPRTSESDSALRSYLEALVETCAPLRLKAIDQSAMRTDRKPLGLTSVYVDLNLDLRIPEKLGLPDYLTKPQRALEAMQPESGETRLVPVLEALAYHPKMVLLGRPGSGKSTLSTYLALSLAEAALGDGVALERLGKWWKLGSLLPVPVVLREFAATLPSGLDRGRAKHLWDHITADLANSGRDAGFSETLRRVAETRGALFLLDGLDEAGDEARRGRVLEAVGEFTCTAGAKCRFLITSRPYAWEEATAPVAAVDAKSQQPRLESLPPAYRLADFEPKQIQDFIQHWYHAIADLGWIAKVDAGGMVASLQGAVHRPDLAMLARNPLLLTLMATLHSNRTRLPDDRADLYNEVVELLLQRWNETIGADRGLLEALHIPSLKLSNLRERIEQLAFEAHSANVGKEGTADIGEVDLLKGFCPLLGGSYDKAALVVAYIEKRAGLLLGQGSREGQRQFTFPHRTFQEYLAACYLARQPDFRTRAVDLARAQSAHWREVLILATRRASADAGVPVADALVHGERFTLWSQTHTLAETDWRTAMLAAEQLIEIGLASITSREEHQVVRERVVGWLVALLDKEGLPARDRANAGNMLARLGDPRLEVVPRSLEDLGAMEFCYVPPGDFLMGKDNPKNQPLGYGFWIARLPVSVAQFALFVRDGGYGHPDFWPEAIQNQCWRNGKFKPHHENDWTTEPMTLGFPFDQLNHPVVGVSWYEAMAFSRWLSEQWNTRLTKRRTIRLPSETEWEKAARGGKEIPEQPLCRRWAEGLDTTAMAGLVSNPDPQRSLPWLGSWDTNKANGSKTGIGATSTVGCFPAGASPCGALELSGNTWEWCENWYDDKSKESRVLRGGSFRSGPASLSCSSRNGSHPGGRLNSFGFRVVCVAVSAR